MTEAASLLPPASTPLERAIEQVTARVGAVPCPILDLWSPADCPAALLPWLAWALSTDAWEPDWTEAQKRQAVADAIEVQRHKATPAAIDAVLAVFDANEPERIVLEEWFQMNPPGPPHTFDIVIPWDPEAGPLSTAVIVDSVARAVARVKRASSHMRIVQRIAADTRLELECHARPAGLIRFDMEAV